MTRKQTVLMDFVRYAPSDKFSMGNKVIDGVTDNAEIFPALPVDVKTLQADNEALSKAITAAADGGRTSKAALASMEKQWSEDFREVGVYVNSVAKGSEKIILLAGYLPSRNDTRRAQTPDAVKNMVATPTPGKGAVTIGCDVYKGIHSFAFIAATEGVTICQNGSTITATVGNATVYFEVCTKRKSVLHNVTSGLKLNVQMLAINTAGSGPLSDAESIIPQ